MKNHRDVCCATNAGYSEYTGLPGRVRTGCPNTPAYKSAYCDVHRPAMGTHHFDGGAKDEPVGLIIGKRTTRTSTMFQVSSARLYYTEPCQLKGK
jgi:hypothetical protein